MSAQAGNASPPVKYEDEHEFEPSYGLPELLPAGERLLWQGSPDWRVIARDAMHVRAIAIYFGLMLAWRAASLWSDGAGLLSVITSVGVLTALAGVALATLSLIAWLVSRTTVYTVTDQRVVMRIGVVLSVTFNLPYRRIEAAGLRLNADGSGDIPLRLAGKDRIGLVHLWPHARPWQFTRTQPMLRGVPNAARVAGMMAGALAASAGVSPLSVVPTKDASAAERPASGSTGHQPLAA